MRGTSAMFVVKSVSLIRTVNISALWIGLKINGTSPHFVGGSEKPWYLIFLFLWAMCWCETQLSARAVDVWRTQHIGISACVHIPVSRAGSSAGPRGRALGSIETHSYCPFAPRRTKNQSQAPIGQELLGQKFDWLRWEEVTMSPKHSSFYLQWWRNYLESLFQ